VAPNEGLEHRGAQAESGCRTRAVGDIYQNVRKGISFLLESLAAGPNLGRNVAPETLRPLEITDGFSPTPSFQPGRGPQRQWSLRPFLTLPANTWNEAISGLISAYATARVGPRASAIQVPGSRSTTSFSPRNLKCFTCLRMPKADFSQSLQRDGDCKRKLHSFGMRLCWMGGGYKPSPSPPSPSLTLLQLLQTSDSTATSSLIMVTNL